MLNKKKTQKTTQKTTANSGAKKAQSGNSVAKSKARTTSAPPTPEDVIMRGAWDRKQYKRALTVAFVASVTSMVLLILVIMLIMFRPEPRYFSVTGDFRVMELPPLSEPYISDAGLLNWSSNVITRTFSLDFLHYRRQLGDVRKFFAPDAFKELVGSLKSSGIIDMVTQKRLSVSVVLEKAPVIVAKGMVQGVATWKVEIPVVASYESSRGVETTQHLLATMLVQRADVREYPEGIYVKQMVLK